MTWLLRLYPRAWRDRYGEEVAVMLQNAPRTLRLALDLVAGAIDARLNPQWTPRLDAVQEGRKTMGSLLAYCQPEGVSRADHVRSMAWMLGATVVLSLVYIVLKRMYGANALVEAFGIAALPIAMTLSMRWTYFKRYSTAAAGIMMAAAIALVFLITLAATLVGNRL